MNTLSAEEIILKHVPWFEGRELSVANKKAILNAMEEYAQQFSPTPTQQAEWKLVGHSYQIADTGDYDGCYEITNGKISILTKDDDDEALQPIVDALNASGAKFYMDDAVEFELRLEKQHVADLQAQLQRLQSSQAEKEAVEWIPVEERLPDYEKEVLVARPNKYSGKVDVIQGYLHKATPGGQRYGKAFEHNLTFGDWWSFPSIAPLEAVTHWMPLPKPPKE